mgnify:FL=1
MNSKIKLTKKSGLALLAICLGMAISLTACGSKEGTSGDKDSGNQVKSLVNKDGDNIETRYKTPEGFTRVKLAKGSFGEFLRHEKLKKYGEKSYYYNGKVKPSEGVYDSVFDIDLEGKNLLHCADACFKFRGDYLYQTGQYDKIKFNFVSAGLADFSKYTRGYRVDPETGQYFLMAEPDRSEKVYKKFMNVVYGYCGTLSLVKDTHGVSIDDMQIGDVFVRGGTPGTKRVGHAIMVIDMAENQKGEKIFMLAQSYMPAQQTQVLVNKANKEISPWYSLDEVKKAGKMITPQWTFELNELKRFN